MYEGNPGEILWFEVARVSSSRGFKLSGVSCSSLSLFLSFL